jgi:hypothetical protein
MSSLARLKGLPGYVVPAMHLAGVNLVVMINAAVIIEVIFARPGIGRLLYEGIFRRSLAAAEVPSALNPPSGCRFHPRAMPHCVTRHRRKEIAPRCTVACHLN